MSSEAGHPNTTPLLRPWRVDSNNRLIDPSGVQCPTNIYPLGMDSGGYLPGDDSLLNSPSNITLARSFDGAKAQMFINFLDQVSRSHAPFSLDSLWDQT